LKYIKGSSEKGLLYDYNNYTKVICYLVANWTRSLSDKRFTFGYCVLNVDNLIS